MVSIIVPVYKVEQYLRRCVDSICCQTYRDLEIILVDDGSPDGCGAICDEYAGQDSRIKVIHKENGGASNARNRGLDIARGEYLTFCDSDDFYNPGWIAALVEAMEREPVDMVCAGFTFYHEDVSLNSAFYGETGFYEMESVQQRINYCFSKLFGGKHGWNIWSRLFRKDVIQKHGLRFCETCGNFAEDICFVAEYVLHCRYLTVIPETGYMYFQRSGSMMNVSAGQAKLDSVNEVSLYFAENSRKILPPELAQQMIPVFHFCFLFNQYQVLMLTASPRSAAEQIRKIARYDEWAAETKAIFSCRETLVQQFGKGKTKRILKLSDVCLTGNWESAISRFRRYIWLKERCSWLKEAVQHVLGGK